MTQEKSWREMLADVNAERAKDREQDAQECRRADVWLIRLHEVFNNEAVNRFMPLTLAARREIRDVRRQAAALSGEIMEKLRNKELTIAEVNMIATQTRDIMPGDPKVVYMLRPIAAAALRELEMLKDDDGVRSGAREQEIAAASLAVFKCYLAQQPSVVPVLAAMMTEGGKVAGVAMLSEKVGLPLGVKELLGLAEQVNDILDNSHRIPAVHVTRCPNEEFMKQPSATITDDLCDFYFRFGGTQEVRAAVRDALVSQQQGMAGPSRRSGAAPS